MSAAALDVRVQDHVTAGSACLQQNVSSSIRANSRAVHGIDDAITAVLNCD